VKLFYKHTGTVQVVELNLLDMELMNLREERTNLLDTVARLTAGFTNFLSIEVLTQFYH
jgi:hypothetical protein